MKTLPDNPDLDHLRRQAKGLLDGLRSTSPDASLADAQAALAQLYGFRGWPELKAEVDRRRGGADAADETLAAEIADRYGLGAVTAGMHSVARADEMGRQWSLATEHGRWAVRSLDTWIPIVDAETDVRLQEAAAKAGIALPTPMRSTSGRVVESIGGRDWRVNEWIAAGPPLVAPVDATTAAAVGQVLATLHGLGLPVERVSPWHATRLSSTGWAALAGRASARGADWAAALAERTKVLVELQHVGEGTAQAGPVLTHNSLIPANVRLGRDDRPIVFGWEHAGGQPPAWELSEGLAQWTVRAGQIVNTVAARAMVDGYRQVAGDVPDLGLASFSGAATALVNYVSGQVEWALYTPAGEDRHFADRSVRHLLANLPSRATYERILSVLP